MLVPEGAEPNVTFQWKQVPRNCLVGRLEKDEGVAEMEFVTVWAKLPELTVYLDVMTRYGEPAIIIQWRRDAMGGKVWTHDPEMGEGVFMRRNMEECTTDELKVVGIKASSP